MSELTVAIDLGGTHLRGALVTPDGDVVIRRRLPTPVADPQPSVIPSLIKEVLARGGEELSDEELQVRAGEPYVAGTRRAVVGVPGIVDHDEERLVTAPNIPSRWVSWLSEEWLSEQTGLAVSLANDADLAAVGEANFGAGKDHHDVAYVTISTGVGAGVVVGNTLVRGRLSGGELGHTVIDRADTDGRPTTVEGLGSGTAIERAAEEAGISARGAELADLVRAGSPEVVEIWNEAIEAVGLGIANLAWLVAPQVVVIGGGVGRNHDLVAPIIRNQLLRHGPQVMADVEIVSAALGDDAALAGAAAWWDAVGRG